MTYVMDDESGERAREERRRLSRQQIIEHAKKSLLFTPFDVKWVPHRSSFVAVGQHANNDGAAVVFDLSRGALRPLCESRGSFPLKCGTFSHNSPNTTAALTLCAGDFGGGLTMWDVERLADSSSSSSSSSLPSSSSSSSFPAAVFRVPHAHESIVNTIDGARFSGPPEVASGGRDGAVRIWDARQSARPVAALRPADNNNNNNNNNNHNNNHKRVSTADCWAVRFGNSRDADERVVAAGYDNGDVKLFDLRMQRVLHEFNVGNGVCDLDFDRPDIDMNKIVVASLEGRVRVYDLRTLHPTLGYAFVEERVTNGTVWCARALPQDRETFICGGGGELTLCRYKYPPERQLRDGDGAAKGVAGSIEELNRARVGDQPIHAVDWNKEKEGLLACASFDQSIRVMLVTKLSLLR